MSSPQMFIIGLNVYGDLGINQSDKVNILTPCPEKKITKAFSGDGLSIYTDHNTTIYGLKDIIPEEVVV